jgi:cell division protein FtsB
MAGSKRSKARRRPVRTMRWLVLGVALLVGFLYYRPLSTYVETKRELSSRATEVRELENELKTLERRLASARHPDAVERQARRLGLVKPGERLFIVKGVRAWRRSHKNR